MILNIQSVKISLFLFIQKTKIMNNKMNRQISPYINTYDYLKHSFPKASQKKKPDAELSDLDRKALTMAAEIWKDYIETQEGKDFMESFKTMDLPTAQRAVSDLLKGSLFDAVKALYDIANENDIIPHSFSIALNAQVEFIVGLNVVLGAAIGIGESRTAEASEFLSVGLVEGLEEDVFAGVQFGIWSPTPENLGGFSWATEVDLGDGVDVDAAVIYNVTQLLGATVTVGAGEGLGIAEEESWTFILGTQGGGDKDNYLQPAYQDPAGKPNFLRIVKLTCKNQSESGNDEVFLNFSSDSVDNSGTNKTYYYPTYDYYSMDDNDDHAWHNWYTGCGIWFNNQVYLKIWDDGTGNRHQNADLMLSKTINLSDFAGVGSTKTYNLVNPDGAGKIEYTVVVKLLATDVVHQKPQIPALPHKNQMSTL